MVIIKVLTYMGLSLKMRVCSLKFDVQLLHLWKDPKCPLLLHPFEATQPAAKTYGFEVADLSGFSPNHLGSINARS